jgi:hypothetical protein
MSFSANIGFKLLGSRLLNIPALFQDREEESSETTGEH